MCGIAGFSFLKPNLKLSKNFLKVKDYLYHRGPDSSGSYENDHLTLVHTRLSIIDLDGGNQPIENNDYVLIVNGEIYNDPEIRIENKSYKYITNSDSESILALYHQSGIDGLKKLRGMFSFAIYDKNRDELIIGRDEFGIKPLYFALVDEGIIFNSELKSLKAIKKKRSRINLRKFSEFMQLQYCSGTKTIYNEVNRVAPGQILVIKKGRIVRSIRNPLPKRKKLISEINEKYISESLIDSISCHLRSDVPYCIFFSGGIDSMLLLYYLNLLKKDHVSAFTVYFDDDSKKKNLKHITKQYNIDLIEEKFSEDDFWNWIFFAAKNIDEPVADYAILPTFKLASIASKKFKVVITGEGGDELFGGYGRYKKNMRPFLRNNSYYPKGTFARQYPKIRFPNWDFDLKSNNRFFSFEKNSSLQNSQLFDYNNWLPNNLLVKLDRCLMTYGMEGRTPFIDKKLFEKLFFVSDDLKIKRRFGKYFIRRFLNSKINFYNSFEKKKGFSVPIYKWIPKKIDYLEDLLPRIDFLENFIGRGEIKSLCKATKKNRRLAKPLWHIIFFTSWYLVNERGIKPEGNYFDVLSDYI